MRFLISNIVIFYVLLYTISRVTPNFGVIGEQTFLSVHCKMLWPTVDLYRSSPFLVPLAYMQGQVNQFLISEGCIYLRVYSCLYAIHGMELFILRDEFHARIYLVPIKMMLIHMITQAYRAMTASYIWTSWVWDITVEVQGLKGKLPIILEEFIKNYLKIWHVASICWRIFSSCIL